MPVHMIKVKVIIPIIIIIIIIIIITAALVIFTPIEKTSENKIEKAWIKSGSFEIDKSEYMMGEKIFLSTTNLLADDKGIVQFLRPINDTHNKSYIKIPFDGSDKTQFNYYFEPRFNALKGICSIDDIKGYWIVKFLGTQYEDINFKIIGETNSWDDRTFEPIC
tara:strand:- start:13 stop:504 length:492 start_codon:yes stop_codon:yes gene_type:complete